MNLRHRLNLAFTLFALASLTLFARADAAPLPRSPCLTPEQVDALAGEIRASTVLCGGVYRPLVITNSDILLDCAGECVILADYEIGVRAQNVDRVSIANLTIRTITPRAQEIGSLGALNIASACGVFRGVGVSLIDAIGATVDHVKIVYLNDGPFAGVVGVDICGGGEHEIINSDLSHTTGWGVRVVASDRNRIYRNVMRENVRADGSANESANILIVGSWAAGKGADENVVYANVLEHGGDGVYINGFDFPTSNRNLVIGNTITRSIANCLEGTGNPTPGTSGTNIFLNNTIAGCGEHLGWITHTVDTVFCGNGKGAVDARASIGALVDASAECTLLAAIQAKGLPTTPPPLKNAPPALLRATNEPELTR